MENEMDATKSKAGKAADQIDAAETALASSRMTPEELRELANILMVTTAAAGTAAGKNAAEAFMFGAKADITKSAEEVANKAVAQALSRQQKTSTLKTYGATAAVSAGVFVAGTLAMIGIDRYKHRNDQRSRDLNPQYQQLAQT